MRFFRQLGCLFSFPDNCNQLAQVRVIADVITSYNIITMQFNLFAVHDAAVVWLNSVHQLTGPSAVSDQLPLVPSRAPWET